jgi:hypothetical protein
VIGPIAFALLYFLFVGEGSERIFSALVLVGLLAALIWENQTLLKRRHRDNE